MKRISVENLTIFTGRLLANGQVAHPTRLPGTLDAMQERSGFRLANVAIPWLLYLAGFLVFFRWQLWSSFNLVFGDRGDTRLICFIHEHVYHWLTGGAALLSPPFFFNWTKTLGYSDAFLLDQAIYAPLRLMGVEPYLALSLVAFILSPAAYFFTYLLLRRLHLSVPMAALAALIFTFANNQYLKSVHLQHFAIYYLPIVAYCAVRAVDELHRRPLVSCLLGAFAAGLFGAVFSTGYYMAWFFALALLISTPIAAYIARKEVAAWWRAGPRLALALALVAVGGFAASLSIFFVIYAPALATGAMRTFQDYMFYAPRPYDLINVGRENMVWSGLIRSLHLVRADHLANTERSIAMTPVLQALVVAALLVSLRPGFWPANPAGRMSQAFAVAGAGVCLASRS